MINLFLLAIALSSAFIHLSVQRKTLTKEGIVDLFLIYILVISVGIGGTFAFVEHIFFGEFIAEQVGPQPGVPFQFELGFCNGGWALLGFLSLRWHGGFWVATGLGFSFFLLGAAYGHIYQMIFYSNSVPYNTEIILPDLVLPITLLILLYLRFRNGVIE